MRYISEKKARGLCGDYHNGQWSIMYQFNSTGFKYKLNYTDLSDEIVKCYHDETNERRKAELKKLLTFFIYHYSIRGKKTSKAKFW